MQPTDQFLKLFHDIAGQLDRGISLKSLARRTGQSPFRIHREFRRGAGETLKQFALRVQLERAAARLVCEDDEVLRVAWLSGFASHEVFTRAFRRYFKTTPTLYREKVRAIIGKADRPRHLALTRSIGPCIRFFHHPAYKNFYPREQTVMPTLSIARKEIAPIHILYIRRRIAPSQMQATLGECFGMLFTHGAKMGLPIAGQPLCRYVSTGQGLWTIDPAMPLAAPAQGTGEMHADILPGGPVALGIHGGPYAELPDTNAAIERWIEANGYEVDGAPWEQYVTDPGEHPNPADWRTNVYWPLKK
jgi:AraC family transcriptional regulator